MYRNAQFSAGLSMIKKMLSFWLISLPVTMYAASPVSYNIDFPNAVHHEARISVTYQDVGSAAVEFRMSRSSPGRYALHEFAKNVYKVSAVDGNGKNLPISRPNPYQWDVSGHNGTVTLSYTLYADRAGGTYSGIDLTHAHLNMPATFMWARGFDERPITITFHPLDNWKIATQLEETANPHSFKAPDLQYFLDSPTELSNFSDRHWTVKSSGKNYNFRLVIHHDGNEDDVDEYLKKAKNIVEEQIAVFGELPNFDFGTYTFIADYLPHVSGDGMEHRNSTILVSTSSLYESDFSQLSTLSHEFIHSWNVERIRPKDLEPFVFEGANMSPSLWFAEGFTSYYGNLIMRRGDHFDDDEYLEVLGKTVDYVIRSPGRGFASPEGMSIQAPFRDAATAIDPTNFANSFISYYSYGHAIAAALDLSLREKFTDLTLDNYMSLVWQKYGKNEVPYTDDDLRDTLVELTDDQSFANDFFSRFISESEIPDYKSLLENAGFLLRNKNEDAASLGDVSFKFEGKAALINQNTLIGSPLYQTGLDKGDQILKVGRFNIHSQSDWDRAMERHKKDEKTTIQYRQRGIERSGSITFIQDQQLEIVSFEKAELEVSEKQKQFRLSWLGEEKTKP